MTNKTTFKDIETLTEAKDKIEQLQEQYSELTGSAKEQHFEEIVKLQEQVEKAEKRMIKRIKKVVVLNEMEEARRIDLEERITLFIRYIKLDENFESAVDIVGNLVGGAFSILPDFFLFYFAKVSAALTVGIISIPIALGILVAITGVNLVRLMPYIIKNTKLKHELQASGLYDKIVEFLKSKGITRFELGDNSYDGYYEEFVNDEIGHGV